MQNKIILALFAIILVVVPVGAFLFLQPEEKEEVLTDETEETDSSGIVFTHSTSTPIDLTEDVASSSVATSTQKKREALLYTGVKEPGRQIFIDLAVLEKDGFIVVFENTFEPTGETVGVSMYLPKGEYARIPIALSREVLDGESFTAMLHEDNGDREFDITEDVMFRNEKQESIFTQVQIQSLAPEDTMQ